MSDEDDEVPDLVSINEIFQKCELQASDSIKVPLTVITGFLGKYSKPSKCLNNRSNKVNFRRCWKNHFVELYTYGTTWKENSSYSK